MADNVTPASHNVPSAGASPKDSKVADYEQTPLEIVPKEEETMMGTEPKEGVPPAEKPGLDDSAVIKDINESSRSVEVPHVGALSDDSKPENVAPVEVVPLGASPLQQKTQGDAQTNQMVTSKSETPTEEVPKEDPPGVPQMSLAHQGAMEIVPIEDSLPGAAVPGESERNADDQTNSVNDKDARDSAKESTSLHIASVTGANGTNLQKPEGGSEEAPHVDPSPESKETGTKSEGEKAVDLELTEGKDMEPKGTPQTDFETAQVVDAGNGSSDQTESPTFAIKEGSPTLKPAPKMPQTCIVCKKVGKCKYNIVRNGDIKHLCEDSCFKTFRQNPTKFLRQEKAESTEKTLTPPTSTAQVPASATLCNFCQTTLTPGKQSMFKLKVDGDTKHFCQSSCRDAFQKRMKKSNNCNYCHAALAPNKQSMFGLKVDGEMKPFCQQSCMEEYQKRLKLCANCNREVRENINSFMAPIVEKGNTTFRDFCSPACLTSFNKTATTANSSNDNDVEIVGTTVEPRRRARGTDVRVNCAVCGKLGEIRHEVNFDGKNHKLCSEACFAAFRYTNKLAMNQCSQCEAFCVNEGSNPHSIQFEGQLKRFCSVKCVTTFKVGKTKIQPCAWCGTKKHNFDMIERVDATNKYQLFCSLSCLSLYRVNLQATSNQSVTCDHCKKVAPAQYHLTMSDASVRNFCMYNCVMAFQAQFNTPASGKAANRPPTRQVGAKAAAGNLRQTVPPQTNARQASPAQTNTRARQVTKVTPQGTTSQNTSFPVISNVVSLAPNTTAGKGRGAAISTNKIQVGATVSVGSQIIIQPPPPKSVKNKSLLCKPFVQTKATMCRPHTVTLGTQTDESLGAKQVLVPVPVPIFVPVPMAMYNTPQPYPIPIPVPIPVPCFIPTTKKSGESILKQIKEIQERMPADPFEAELLMMAEAVANAEKSESSGSDTEIDEPKPAASESPYNSSLAGQPQGYGSNTTNDRGEDMLQIALRMAEMPPGEDTALDLEDTLASHATHSHPASGGASDFAQGNAFQTNYQSYIKEPNIGSGEFSTIDQDNDILTTTRDTRSGARGKRRRGRGGGGRNKRARIEELPRQPDQVTPMVTGPAPDANMVLKYTYGVNAWKHWVVCKNEQLERASSGRSGRLKLFKTEIMQCSADELNYSLCLFVKEVRKPNGDEYAPDSIYYLCLGIQQYLFENGRIDNIFTDFYYEKFTECLNEVLHRYEVRLNTHGLIVCRIEEEHLWESKQLGAHSPHVLLNTLIYFNTKYFLLRTPEDHLRLSFSHIMKHWKKTNAPGTKTPGRSVYLRYYAPVNSKESSSKRKREEVPVYEQGENADNPLRCPVKLYEFYLSKCVFSSPESIKNRNDVFYLVPERSCVPDSPVWYSTASLGVEAMTKMLNRVRVVREIQEAHLHHQPALS